MIHRQALALAAFGLFLLTAPIGNHPAPKPAAAAYAPARSPTAADTLHPRLAGLMAGGRHRFLAAGVVIEGFLSPRGLPPTPGHFIVTDSGLVFHSTDGALTRTFPLVGPVRHRDGRSWRASAVTLAEMDDDADHPVYLFRVDGGVFETAAPGPLLDLADHPVWLDSLDSREWRTDPALVDPSDSIAVRAVAEGVASGTYADTLYSLFGRPSRGVGLVGERGRSGGRLGEFIASRDSLALDPGRMTSEAQLRHTFAHELGHRWQARSTVQMELLWQGIAPIRDPRRYGYGDVSEHQAEAIAFAVHYLQTTAAAGADGGALTLLGHYELLVPGTTVMVRYLAMQPIYARHPLRRSLTFRRTEGQTDRRSDGQTDPEGRGSWVVSRTSNDGN